MIARSSLKCGCPVLRLFAKGGITVAKERI
jgi:hypothetical protein